jgi:hypothetical protein
VDLFKALGNLLHGTEQFVGGLVRGAGQTVNNAIRAVVPQQRPQQRQIQQRPQPQVRPQLALPHINLRDVNHALDQLQNTRIPGLGVSAGEIGAQLPNAAKTVVNNVVNPTAPLPSYLRESTARIPETVLRSIAQPGAAALQKNIDASTSQQGQNTGVRRPSQGFKDSVA